MVEEMLRLQNEACSPRFEACCVSLLRGKKVRRRDRCVLCLLVPLCREVGGGRVWDVAAGTAPAEGLQRESLRDRSHSANPASQSLVCFTPSFVSLLSLCETLSFGALPGLCTFTQTVEVENTW